MITAPLIFLTAFISKILLIIYLKAIPIVINTAIIYTYYHNPKVYLLIISSRFLNIRHTCGRTIKFAPIAIEVSGSKTLSSSCPGKNLYAYKAFNSSSLFSSSYYTLTAILFFFRNSLNI